MQVTTVGAFEAKTHFSQLLDRVERGEEIIVTRHGKEVAEIRKRSTGQDHGNITQLIERIKQSALKTPIGEGVSWKDLRDAGRKY